MVDERTFSREARQVLAEAGDIARRAGKTLDSSHLVLAIFTVPCEAQSILLEKRLQVDHILDALPIGPAEANETIGVIYSTAAHISSNLGSRQVTSVHILMAVSRITSCHAARVLEKAGLPMFALRTHAMAHLTDPRLKRAATERLIATGGPVSEGSLPVVLMEARRAPARTTTGNDGTRLSASSPTTSAVIDDDQDPVVFSDLDSQADPTPAEAVSLSVADPVSSPGDGSYTFALDPEEFPTLVSLGRNLTLEAEQGLLDPLIGRRKDLEVVVDILCKRRANNPLLLGDPGVGKTALVEGLATLITSHDPDLPKPLENKVIVGLSVADLLAGTSMRGSFAARLKELKNEVLAAHRRVILFIDEIHTLMGAGVGDGSLDAANDLKGALSRGEFPCIGATTFGEYQHYIQPDSALDRRFENVTLREPSQDEADRILQGVSSIYEGFHHVHYSEDSLRAAVRLTDRFIADRSLPAKAIDLLDRAGARVGRENHDEVTRDDIVNVLAGLVDLPKEFLSVSPSEGLRGMETFLAERIVGHRDNTDDLARILGQNWARFGSRRPLGSFVFAGPHGVGKSTTALAVAEFLFGSQQAFLELDLSDYAEAHSLSHLIGSPPGYVGHEEGGLLSDTLTRRPFLVILWRHVEKAHHSVQSLLAQVLTEGTATDRRGRRMDFRNTVHVLSTSLDSGEGDSGGRTVGFGAGPESPTSTGSRASIASRCRRFLPGDLVSAVDLVLGFDPLGPAEVGELVRRLAQVTIEAIQRDHRVTVNVDPDLMEAACRHCSGKNGTAALVEATLNRLFARPLTDFIQSQSPPRDAVIRARVSGVDDDLTATFEVVDE